MGFAFDRACSRYDAEVETVAAELVEQGVAPWPAMGRAARIVQQRRQRESCSGVGKERQSRGRAKRSANSSSD